MDIEIKCPKCDNEYFIPIFNVVHHVEKEFVLTLKKDGVILKGRLIKCTECGHVLDPYKE